MSAVDQVAETQRLAQAAYEASGAKTHGEFCALFGDALPLRTFRRWLGGHGRADEMGQLVLREFASGWRPGGVDKRGRAVPYPTRAEREAANVD